MNIKLIIFDLDNTLYDEQQHVASGFLAVSEYLYHTHNINKDTTYSFLKNDFDLNGRGKNFNNLIKYLGLHPDTIALLVKVYQEHIPNISCYTETFSLLEKLKQDYKLAIITDGYSQVQRIKVKALNLEPFFDKIIYTGDDDYESKPSQQPYKSLITYFNIDPDQAIYIGDDIRKDFIGAKKLGLHTAQLLRGEYKDIQMSKNHEAEYKITNLTELINIV